MQDSRGAPAGAALRLSDSPWFWTLLFALFALVALAVIVPKHMQRQTRLERMNLARQVSRPGAADSGTAPPELSAADLPAPRVTPLVFVLLGVAACAAGRLYVLARRSAQTYGPGTSSEVAA